MSRIGLTIEQLVCCHLRNAFSKVLFLAEKQVHLAKIPPVDKTTLPQYSSSYTESSLT